MPESKVATEFDRIIQADRQRKQNETLANQIFGRNKKNEQTTRKDSKRFTSAPSLASRIGITKRSSSPRNVPSRPSSAAAQHARQTRIASEIRNNQTANVVSPKPTALGLSIKGSAAPFVVEARNFEAGTSDADIQSVIESDCFDSGGINALVSCKIISHKPTMVAELVFNDRVVADNVITKYHNQRADGHLLELKLVRSGPGSMSKHHKANKTPAVPTPTPTPTTEPIVTNDDDNVMVDIDVEPEILQEDSYEEEREAAERGRKNRETRRERDDYDARGQNRDDERRRDDRDRDRDRGRDRDEGREQDRNRDRGYERNDRDNRPTQPRELRTSHYGNGVGGDGPRPNYGGGYAGGRGSYPGYGSGFGRGNYRGGYRGYR